MSSGFITETEIAEARKRRQEEWEKVRKADDPLEAPEPAYDSRSLYERLQEQKQKRELEYEEAHKLKNMIKGLDDDEIEFLDLVDKTKMAADRRKMIEEEKELNDYRNRVASLQEQNLERKIQSEVSTLKPKAQFSNKLSQTKLLKGAIVAKPAAVKRKLSEDDKLENHSMQSNSLQENIAVKKSKQDEPQQDEVVCERLCSNNPDNTSMRKRKASEDTVEEIDDVLDRSLRVSRNPVMQCIGILPGLGYYEESSSEISSDSDNDFVISSLTDIFARRNIKKGKDNKE